jgi:hypothetical protein
MFKSSNSDNDTDVGHMCSGKPFREVPLANLFKKNYGDKEFYSGEEVDLTDEEHLESARTREVQTEELRREDTETSGIAPTVELSIIPPLVVLAALSNQSNQSS